MSPRTAVRSLARNDTWPVMITDRVCTRSPGAERPALEEDSPRTTSLCAGASAAVEPPEELSEEDDAPQPARPPTRRAATITATALDACRRWEYGPLVA